MNVAELGIGALILLSGFLSMAAGIGVLRFPDLLTRLHAGTKPQVLGLAVVLLAIVLRVPTWGALSTVALIMAFQLLTQPMTAHMLGRSAYRSGDVRFDLLIADDLGRDLAEHDRNVAERRPGRSSEPPEQVSHDR